MLNWLTIDTTRGSVESPFEPMDQSDQVAQTQFLLDRAADGDEQAYDDLIARASDRLLKLTRKMLRRYPKQMKGLRILDVSGTEISKKGAADLQEALPDCVVLYEVLENPPSIVEP